MTRKNSWILKNWASFQMPSSRDASLSWLETGHRVADRAGSRTLDGLADVAKVFGHCFEACDVGSDRGTARHARVATKEVSTRRSKKRDRRTDNGTIATGSFPVTRARGTARRVRGAFSRGNGRRMRTCCVGTVRSLTRAQTKCARRSSPTIADTAGDCQRTAGRVTRTK